MKSKCHLVGKSKSMHQLENGNIFILYNLFHIELVDIIYVIRQKQHNGKIRDWHIRASGQAQSIDGDNKCSMLFDFSFLIVLKMKYDRCSSSMTNIYLSISFDFHIVSAQYLISMKQLLSSSIADTNCDHFQHNMAICRHRLMCNRLHKRIDHRLVIFIDNWGNFNWYL
jgi:hypothetical protein